MAGKRSQRLVRQELQLSGELSAMTAERTDVSGALLAMLYGLGGTLVMHGVFQLGTLVAFIALVSQLYGPLHTMSSLPVEILTSPVGFDRAFEILDLEPLIAERPGASPLVQTGCPRSGQRTRSSSSTTGRSPNAARMTPCSPRAGCTPGCTRRSSRRRQRYG